jgi:hypothetical protein
MRREQQSERAYATAEGTVCSGHRTANGTRGAEPTTGHPGTVSVEICHLATGVLPVRKRTGPGCRTSTLSTKHMQPHLFTGYSRGESLAERKGDRQGGERRIREKWLGAAGQGGTYRRSESGVRDRLEDASPCLKAIGPQKDDQARTPSDGRFVRNGLGGGGGEQCGRTEGG